MESFYSFAAVRGVQAGRAYYVVMVPLRLVERLFHFDDADLPVELRAQRELNRGRVPAIAEYLVGNSDGYILSALAATVDGPVRFDAADGSRSVGTLAIDLAATIVINDGQHRRAGIIEALKERPSLGDETVAVTVYPDEGLQRSQQMFVDLNQYSVKPSRSLRVLYDGRDDFARLARVVVEAVPLLRALTDFGRSSLPKTSRKLFGFSNLHTAIRTFVVEAGLEANVEDPGQVVEYWAAVADALPEWRLAAEGRVTPSELRRERIHSHGVALEAFAIAGARLILDRPNDWSVFLPRLASIDWARSNAGLWEGRALMGGRVIRSRTSVMLTAEVIHRALVGDDSRAVDYRLRPLASPPIPVPSLAR